MLRSALVVDNTNLYYSLRDTFGSRKLIYERYLKALTDHTLLFKVLYASQESVMDFETSLHRQGFETYFAPIDWTVPMTLRIADIIDKVDCIIIGSNNDAAGDIMHWCRGKGKIVKCFAHNVPNHFRQFADVMPIHQSMLSSYATPKVTQPLVVPTDQPGDPAK